MIIAIPAISVHLLNIPVLLTNPGTSALGLTGYVVSSSGLLYSSYRMSRLEKEI